MGGKVSAKPVDLTTLVAGMADLVDSTSGPQVRVIVDAPSGSPYNNRPTPLIVVENVGRSSRPCDRIFKRLSRTCQLAKPHDGGKGDYSRLISFGRCNGEFDAREFVAANHPQAIP